MAVFVATVGGPVHPRPLRRSNNPVGGEPAAGEGRSNVGDLAYDEDLADRLREALQHHDDIAEKRMFGGLAFLLGGHLAVAAAGGGGLLLRCDPADADTHVAADGVERFVMRGRALDGWLFVPAEAIADDAALARWVTVGTTYASSLPPK